MFGLLRWTETEKSGRLPERSAARIVPGSGKPALGVGAGNTPAIIDDTADIGLAVNSIIHSKTFDNGMICASEQSVIVLDKVYDAVKEEFAARGCYFLSPSETGKMRRVILINGALNAKIVGQKPVTIATLAGVTIPEETKVLIGEVESVDISEEFAHEKLSPVLAMYKAEDFEDAIQGDVFNADVAEGGATANDEITTSEVTVIAGEGNVTIANAAGKKVVVSNILGQTIATQVLTSDNAVIAAPQGVVVVAVEGEEAVKAIVK